MVGFMNGITIKPRQKTNLEVTDTNKESRTPYGIPIYELIDTVNRKRGKEELSGEPNNEHNDEVQANKKRTQGSQPTDKTKRRKLRPVQTQLLSEKYRPKEFFDLLGNDDANRNILRWLHYWKACVFGFPPILDESSDRLGRPQRKILLVNGPPGTGKTTAAHVIARQAGFDVLEINASDERGAAVVKDRIVSAVESHQVMSKRPILIVADEVEGASEHGFVRALTNVLNEDAKAMAVLARDGTLNPAKKGKNGKSKKQPSLLLRPIIAVCNDVWSPNLHSLRQHAEIIHFQRHPPVRLIKRLEQICFDEKLVYSTRQLSQIAEQCDYDLRACLNAIQFGATYDSECGSRDSIELTDWSSLVKHQFLHSKPASFQQLESCSDADKLISGCFTAYPESSYIDDMLKKPAAIGDYLAIADNRRAGDELKALTAHAFGSFFRSPRLAAQKSGIALSGAKSFGKPPSYYEETKRTKSIVASALSNSSAALKPYISEKMSLTELFPFIISIANPVARTVLSPEDKARLQSVAKNLKDLGMNIRTEKLENGTFVHRLDPPVELACVFGENSRSEASNGMYVTRSQIKDAIREMQRQAFVNNTSSKSQPTRSQQSSAKSEEASKSKPAANVSVDLSSYFGRSVQESSTQAQRRDEHKASKVWVQYSEGFSNAVRKPIGWNELFGL